MSEKRSSIINKYYTNIKLDKNHLELYSVRTAILDFIQSSLKKFNGTVLDLGCGIMPYREFILENSSCTKYLGVDLDLRSHSEYTMVTPDIFWDGTSIPLEDNSVETILATELLEHCPNPDVILREAFRVLKPGGNIILTVPFVWNLHLVPYDEFRYTPFSLRRFLADSGFSNIELSALGLWDASLAQMLGIWYKNRPSGIKKYFSFLFIWAIKILLKKDKFFDKNAKVYSENVMLTGVAGIATKK